MGIEVVLKQLALLFTCALLSHPIARADELRQPQKLTVALSDELLGQLSPDGKRLYFVSNRNATSEIFTQDLSAPVSMLLFDEGADATWPRVSPDGKSLSYISYADDATGRLCVRKLDDKKLPRRCLDARGALEAEWIDAGEVMLLARPSVEGDLTLSRVSVGAHMKSRPIVARNMNSPTLSPSLAGTRFIAYVPLARAAAKIGPAFAAQAARGLALRKLDGDGAETMVPLALPGGTTQPAFSPDGKWLYFTQFLNDTDQNGVLDGDDHGVIFRARLDGSDVPATLAHAEFQQLTSAEWNCQYPAPSPTRLVVTCARNGSLDVYALPLDGMVPESWSPARIREERAASRDDWERLMLLSRLQHAERDPKVRAIILLDVLRWHLVLAEYEAALFHAQALAQTHAPHLAELAPLLEPLIAERRALRAFDRGELGFQYLESARQRVLDVQKLEPTDPGAVALRHLVLSELFDDLGDKMAALDELDRAKIEPDAPFLVVLLAAARAENLLRQLDRHDELLKMLAPLVDHPSLSEKEKLRLAGVYARELMRPLSTAAGHASAARERASSDGKSARAFGLGLWPCLDDVAKETLAAGRACVNALYDGAAGDMVRRRLIVTEVIRRAEDSDADDLEYELSRRWIHDVPHDSAERPYAERLFRHVIQDYAYANYAGGHYDKAAREFAAVNKTVVSLEAHIGLIESEIAMGKTDLEAIYAQRYQGNGPVTHFMRAYLDVRALPSLDGDAFDHAWQRASIEVQATEQALPQKCEVQALHGALLHLKYLRSDDRALAEEANTHYLLALDLAHDNQRYRAMVLEQLALLHGAVGNDRIAVGHFEARAALPFADGPLQLGHQLGLARSLFHVGREADAAKAASVAVALTNQPALARFRPLALDRAALYALAAGDGMQAAKLYDDAVGTAVAGSARNDIVRALARAAAALEAGRPAETLKDLDRVDELTAQPAGLHALDWPDFDAAEVRATYLLLRLGLRGQAQRALGRLDDAQRTLTERLQLLIERTKKRSYDDDLLALSTAEAQLADLARARNDKAAAGRLASDAVAHADQLAKKTGTPLSDAQQSALRFAAELHVVAGVPASAFGFDVRARVREVYDRLAANADAKVRHQRVLFGVYLTLFGLDDAAAGK